MSLNSADVAIPTLVGNFLMMLARLQASFMGLAWLFLFFFVLLPTHHCNVKAVFLLQHLELIYLYCPNTDTDIESMLSNFVGQSMPFSESVSPCGH